MTKRVPSSEIPVTTSKRQRRAAELEATEDAIHAAAVILGSRGGLVGGPARAAVLEEERRIAIARHAARVRWGKPRGARKADS